MKLVNSKIYYGIKWRLKDAINGIDDRSSRVGGNAYNDSRNETYFSLMGLMGQNIAGPIKRQLGIETINRK